MKQCSKCKLEYELTQFTFRKNKPDSWCKACKKVARKPLTTEQKALKYKKEKQKRETDIEYRQKRIEYMIEYDKQHSKEKNKQRYQKLKSDPEKLKQARKDNVEYCNKRKLIDSTFRLRLLMSKCLSKKVKQNKDSSKLPYSIIELKAHLESQFEPWMNWDNGPKPYDPKTFESNPTWQIDHIIPASTFNYSAVTDKEFLECWALNNLRPLSAKQNIYDGVTKIRHKKASNQTT